MKTKESWVRSFLCKAPTLKSGWREKDTRKKRQTWGAEEIVKSWGDLKWSEGMWRGKRTKIYPVHPEWGQNNRAASPESILVPRRGRRICVPVLDWHSICPVKGAHMPNMDSLSSRSSVLKARKWSYLPALALRVSTQKHMSFKENGNLFSRWQWTWLGLIFISLVFMVK